MENGEMEQEKKNRRTARILHTCEYPSSAGRVLVQRRERSAQTAALVRELIVLRDDDLSVV